MISHTIEASMMIVPIARKRSAWRQCNIFIIAPVIRMNEPSRNETKGHLNGYNEFLMAERNKECPGK